MSGVFIDSPSRCVFFQENPAAVLKVHFIHVKSFTLTFEFLHTQLVLRMNSSVIPNSQTSVVPDSVNYTCCI